MDDSGWGAVIGRWRGPEPEEAAAIIREGDDGREGGREKPEPPPPPTMGDEGEEDDDRICTPNPVLPVPNSISDSSSISANPIAPSPREDVRDRLAYVCFSSSRSSLRADWEPVCGTSEELKS